MRRDEFLNEVLVLGDRPLLSFADLVRVSKLERGLLMDLIETGVLAPERRGHAAPEEWLFPSRSLDIVRSAARLCEAFDLNSEGLVLALTYREHVRRLERELSRLRCLLGE